MTQQRYPVGIDLGTTFSALSYVDDDGRVETVRLEDGAFEMASAIYFHSNQEIVVGDEALRYGVIDPTRVARAFKRHMCDEEPWAFQVDDRAHRAEELSAMVLKKLLREAERKIGKIEEAVISVPFMFDERGRRATENAGQIAGIRVLDIVDEPVAAALAYGRTLLSGQGFYGDAELNNLFSDGVILVYDLGGGTFDLTMMRLKSDFSFEVLATAGDHALGGEDWDQALAEHLVEQYQQLLGSNPRDDLEAMQDIRTKATQAKISLSERPRVTVELHRGESTQSATISRADFETLTEHLIDRTRDTLVTMLEKKNFTPSHIDFILLIGGSSRMPMVSKLLERVMHRPLDMSLPPDTAVSRGAALFAALRSNHRSMQGIKVQTVNPHALGLRARHKRLGKHVNDLLIKANEPTKTAVTKSYPISRDAQSVRLVVLQGDLPDPDECVRIGEATIPGVSAESLRGARVEVSFCYQDNGMMQVNGTVHFPDDRPPASVRFDVHVQGAMSEKEVNEAEAALTGITIE